MARNNVPVVGHRVGGGLQALVMLACIRIAHLVHRRCGIPFITFFARARGAGYVVVADFVDGLG